MSGILLPDDLPPVELNYLQIDQVMTNLLENAARYTPPHLPIEITGEAMTNMSPSRVAADLDQASPPVIWNGSLTSSIAYLAEGFAGPLVPWELVWDWLSVAG